MILKGSQRGHAKALAVHLLRLDENDHVELAETRGFCAEDVTGALIEAEAVAMGTRCRQPLFSVSFNPPADATISDAQFFDAISRVEPLNNLTDQPRLVVFPENDGRRHAHAVWSRIDAETMRAINLEHYKNRLRKVSQELYIEHDWQLPHGLVDGAPKSPLTYSLAEWQEAKRKGVHAGDQRRLIQQCWAASDSAAAFAQALSGRGYQIARGDRRGHVIVSPHGQVVAAARALGKRTKEVRARLGPTEEYPPVAEALAQAKREIGQAFARLATDARQELWQKRNGLDRKKEAMVARHRAERASLAQGQTARWTQESAARAAALKTGLAGLWQWVTGARRQIQTRNASDVLTALERDRDQRAVMRQAHLQDRRQLEAQRVAARKVAFGLVRDLKADYQEMFRADAPPPRARKKRRGVQRPRRTQGPELEL